MDRERKPLWQGPIFLERVPQGCPCGFYTDPTREYTCTMPQVLRYRSKISGPLMDRIDIHVEVPAVKYRDLTGEVRERIPWPSSTAV